MNRRQLPDDTPTDTPSEKALIRLHRQVRFLLNILYIYIRYINIYIHNK